MRCGRKSGYGTPRVAFIFERARGVHHGRRDRPPIVCRSPVLCTPFGRLAAPTSLARRASLPAGRRWKRSRTLAPCLRFRGVSSRDATLKTTWRPLRPRSGRQARFAVRWLRSGYARKGRGL